MAGGGHHQSVRLDPAIERWAAMVSVPLDSLSATLSSPSLTGRNDAEMADESVVQALIFQRENVYQNFTFTRRASRTAIALGILVPGAIALVAMAYDNKFDMAGKRRGDSLITGQTAKKE